MDIVGSLVAKTLKVSVDDICVCEVLRIFLKLASIRVLKPEIVASSLAGDAVAPAVTVALDVIASIVGQECLHCKFSSVSGLRELTG